MKRINKKIFFLVHLICLVPSITEGGPPVLRRSEEREGPPYPRIGSLPRVPLSRAQASPIRYHRRIQEEERVATRDSDPLSLPRPLAFSLNVPSQDTVAIRIPQNLSDERNPFAEESDVERIIPMQSTAISVLRAMIPPEAYLPTQLSSDQREEGRYSPAPQAAELQSGQPPVMPTGPVRRALFRGNSIQGISFPHSPER